MTHLGVVLICQVHQVVYRLKFSQQSHKVGTRITVILKMQKQKNGGLSKFFSQIQY